MTFGFRAKGRVQGVGYRAFVIRQARARNIVGWVRNEADGSVAGQASGDASDLALFRSLLCKGPAWAFVESLDWEPLNEGESLPTSFEIRS
ncbi:MAG: acylphosphatase [Holophagaceae bacterium]|nr:acylphosphatase [Holophagaceae bacterium]